MKKKLLFLTSRLPYPTTSGRKNVMFYYCKYLHEMYGYEIINVSFLEEGDDLELKPEFISKSYPLKNVPKVSKVKNLLFDTIIKKQERGEILCFAQNADIMQGQQNFVPSVEIL